LPPHLLRGSDDGLEARISFRFYEWSAHTGHFSAY
jgi:hypothetical protein